MDFNTFNGPMKYGATFDGDITISNAGGSLYACANTGIPFCTVTSVGTAVMSAAVSLLSDDYVTNSRTAYLGGIKITGTQPWTESAGSTTVLKISDKSGSVFAYISAGAIKALGTKQMWFDMAFSGGSLTGSPGSVSLTNKYIEGGKASASRGFQIEASEGTLIYGTSSGSPFYVTIWGVIK